MRVDVYWNLHKDCWSIRDCKTGRVVKHTDRALLRDVSWVVQPAGRSRVLRERRKNVHAFARGTLVEALGDASSHDGGWVYYNPYRLSTFVDAQSFEPLRASDWAVLGTSIEGRPDVQYKGSR